MQSEEKPKEEEGEAKKEEEKIAEKESLEESRLGLCVRRRCASRDPLNKVGCVFGSGLAAEGDWGRLFLEGFARCPKRNEGLVFFCF